MNVLMTISSVEPDSKISSSLHLGTKVKDHLSLIHLVRRKNHAVPRKLMIDTDDGLQDLVQVLLEPKISRDSDIIPALFRRLTWILILQTRTHEKLATYISVIVHVTVGGRTRNERGLVDPTPRMTENAVISPGLCFTFESAIESNCPILCTLRVCPRERRLKGIGLVEQTGRPLCGDLWDTPMNFETRLAFSISTLSQIVRLLSLNVSHRL
jgi:hypothetical protein